jgi:hypothetical protein
MSLDVESRTSKSAKVDSSSTNIPTSFDHTASGSLALTGIAYAAHLCIVNRSTSRIAYNYTWGNPTTNPTTVDGYLDGKGSGDFVAVIKDDIKVSSCVYLMSDTGSAITSGIVTVETW